METRDLTPPEGHTVTRTPELVNRDWHKNKVEFKCSCGASWLVSEKELAEGIDHIEDHYRYARKQPTKPD